MSKTAVVILNWNGAQFLKQFLPSVCLHTPEAAEIIVADNGSTDTSHDAVAAFPRVKWLPLGENYGFAEGYNRALHEITADYYVLLNSDVEVAPNWLEPMTDFLDKHPEVAACQPKIKSYHQRSFFEHAGAAGGLIDALGRERTWNRHVSDLATRTMRHFVVFTGEFLAPCKRNVAFRRGNRHHREQKRRGR